MRNPEEAHEEDSPMRNLDAQDGNQDEPDRPLIPAEECFNPYVYDFQSPVTSSAAGADISSQTPSEVVVQDTHPNSSSFVIGHSLPLPHTSDRALFNVAIQDEHNRRDNNLDNNNVTPRDEDL